MSQEPSKVIDKIPLYSPFIEEDEIRAVTQVLKSGYLKGGVQVEHFEQELAHYLGCNHVVCFNSATAALHAALIAVGIGQGDEVIVPSFTFPATVQIPLAVMAKPVFADVEYYSWNITPKAVEESVTEHTKVIMPVSAFGLPYDLEGIRAIADKHKLLVIGDDSCSIGAKYYGTRLGGALCDLHDADGKLKTDARGVKLRGKAEDISVFSFHQSKVMTTGEGGCLCTDNNNWASRAAMFRDHASIPRELPEPKQRFVHIGLNYRMTDVAAAMGRVQLQKLDEMILRRRVLAGVYTDLIQKINPIREYTTMPLGSSKVRIPEYNYVVTPPTEPEGYYHTFQRYVIYLEQHDGIFVRNELRKRGVECSFGFYDVTAEPFVADFGIYKRCPHARLFQRKTVALPLYHTMTRDQQDKVVETLREVLSLPQPPSEELRGYENEGTTPV